MWYKISNGYMWVNNEEKQFYPGGYKWQPWDNTLLYLPLESDVVDQSWKSWRTFTTSWLSYTTVGWVPSLHIWTTWWLKLTAPYWLQSDLTKPITVSVLLYRTTTANWFILDMAASNSNRQIFRFVSGQLEVAVYNHNSDSTYAKIYADFTTNQWNHIVYTITKTASNLYVNWALISSWQWNPTYPWWLRPYSHDNTQWIFCDRNVNSYASALNWNARELIMEEVEWTAQQVADYYTMIKGKLWF